MGTIIIVFLRRLQFSSAGCMNQLVMVKYDSATSAIICQFMSQTTTSKSCSIKYGHCNQMLVYTSLQKTSTLNTIVLDVDPDKLECYVVTAVSDEVTIIVEGRSLSAGT